MITRLLNSGAIASPSVLIIPVTLLLLPLLLKETGTEFIGKLLFLNTLIGASQILSFGSEKKLLLEMIENEHRISLTRALYIAFTPCVFILAVSASLIALTLHYSHQFLFVDYIYLILIGALQQVVFLVARSVLYSLGLFRFNAQQTLLHSSMVYIAPLILLNTSDYNSHPFLLWSVVASKTIIALYCTLIAFKKYPKTSTNQVEKIHFSDIYTKGKWMGISTSIFLLFESVERYFIQSFLGMSAVAIYAIPIQITQKMAVLPVSLSQAIYAEKNKLSPQNYLKEIRLISLISWPPMVLSAVFGTQLLQLWLGAAYDHKMIDILIIGLAAFTFWGVSHILSTLGEIQNNPMKFALVDVFGLLIYVSIIILANESLNIFHFSMLLLFREVNTFALKLLLLKIPAKRAKGIILNMGVLLATSICFLHVDGQISVAIAVFSSLFLIAFNFNFIRDVFSNSYAS